MQNDAGLEGERIQHTDYDPLFHQADHKNQTGVVVLATRVDVPLPSTLALFALGLLAMRRRMTA